MFVLIWTAITKYHKSCISHNKKFLTILEVGKAVIKMTIDLLPGEDTLCDLEMSMFSLYFHIEEKRTLVFPFVWVLIKFLRAPPLLTQLPSKGPTSKTIRFSSEIQVFDQF